jgi:hypothetical protein
MEIEKTFAEMYGVHADDAFFEWERKVSEFSAKLESVKEGSAEERELLGLSPDEGLFAMRGFSEA